MITLGLDISTSSTGWAVLFGSSLLDYGRIDFPPDVPTKKRLVIFAETIAELATKFSLTDVVIEDTFVRFDPSVTKKLSRFAGVAIYALTVAKPDLRIALVPSQSIRAALYPKQKVDKQFIKLAMIQKFALVPSGGPEYPTLIKKFCDDITDAIAAAHYPFLKEVKNEWIV